MRTRFVLEVLRSRAMRGEASVGSIQFPCRGLLLTARGRRHLVRSARSGITVVQLQRLALHI